MCWVVAWRKCHSWIFQRLKKAAEYQPISGFCRAMPVAMRLPGAFLAQSPDFTSVPDDGASVQNCQNAFLILLKRKKS
jgi:hypothetical protein